MRRRRFKTVALMGLWMMTVGWLLQATTPVATGNAVLAPPLKLNLILSARLDGASEPCGCPGGPSGGFSRRVAFVRSLTADGEPVVQLDAGNSLLKTRLGTEAGPVVVTDPRVTGQKMARLMAAAGVQAVAVGPRDLQAVGLDGLRALMQETRLPWLSANLLDSQGKRVFPGSMVINSGGLRLGVVGLTDPQVGLVERQGMSLMDTSTALKAAALELAGKVDVSVLLTSLAYEEIESLRGSLSPFDLLVVGSSAGGRFLRAGDRAPYILSVPGEGRQLARVALRITPARVGEASKPLLFSANLDRRLRNLESSQRVLQDFARDILEELGRPDPARLARDTASVREEIAVLKTEPPDPPGTRVFATSTIPLDERVGEDPTLQALMKSADGRGGGTSGAKTRTDGKAGAHPQTPDKAKPPR